jgi:parallel beta-helix repeat protein
MAITILLMSSPMIHPLFFEISANPDLPVHNINTGLNYATIREAIDASVTLSGHTIRVDAGTYHEHLTINKAIALIGEDALNTIIDGEGTETIIKVTANNVNISRFTIQNSGSTFADAGIYLYLSDRNHISRTTLKNNSYGIYLFDSSHNVFSFNNVSNNNYGIYLFESSYNIFSINNVSNNKYGIHLSNSIYNVLSNNTVASSDHGIHLYQSGSNLLSNNKVSSSNVGIYIETCPNAHMFHNNFVNNTKQLSNIDSTISLDNGMEGNYWSDYNGTDTNKDAIGDTPYIIDATTADKYPLMGQASDYKVDYEEQTYDITIISNSTISEFKFNNTTRMINFKTIALNETLVFYRVVIPLALIGLPYLVFVDGEKPYTTMLPISNATHAILYFTFVIKSHKVTIVSKQYFELQAKYNILLTNYFNLNMMYIELLASYNALLANYTQLHANIETLNATYYQVFGNYTDLKGNYSSLENSYNMLVERDDSLNSTYNNLLASYGMLQLKYDITINELANIRNLMYIFTGTTMVGIISVIILLGFGIKYYRIFNRQKKIIQTYERELESISQANPLEIAKIFFKTDVERRRAKIGKFEEKYGIRIRPRDTLEDVIKSMRVGEKKDKDTH